jgi:hypothetical protein
MGSGATLTRIFSDDKVIDSPALNRAGVQLLRLVLARVSHALRRGEHHPLLTELGRTGLVVIGDFLPEAEFASWRAEAVQYMASAPPRWTYVDGTTRVHQFSLNSVDLEGFPHLAAWPRHEGVLDLVGSAERRRLRTNDGHRVIERLMLGDYSSPDSQTDLHVDTFFDTHKVWLYLDDVTPENAPFVYVPGSHINDRVRLRYEYLESTTTNRGSRRVSDREVAERGLERRTIICRRNTLVLANTHGYHCRSVGTPGASRHALHMSFRFNPFSLRRG